MNPGARENAEFRPYVNIGFRERPAKRQPKKHKLIIILLFIALLLSMLLVCVRVRPHRHHCQDSSAAPSALL